MSRAVAMKSQEYYTIFPSVFQRTRTKECERDALDMLAAYRDFNKISHAEYDQAKREIITAPHDDAVSNIMTKLRKRINW